MKVHFYKYANKRHGKFNTLCQMGMIAKAENEPGPPPYTNKYYGNIRFPTMTTSENRVTCTICIEELVRIHRTKLDNLLRRLKIETTNCSNFK